MRHSQFTILCSLLTTLVSAQESASCAFAATPSGSIRPSVASGYEYAVVATGLTEPRSLQFDSEGHLLAIQVGTGLWSHTIEDNGGVCVGISDSKALIEDEDLTHSVGLSPDGQTIYVSTADEVHSYEYNPQDSTVDLDSRRVLVQGMAADSHPTRTLVIPRNAENMLVVAKGSGENVDTAAEDITSGVSTVKAFNLTDVPDGGWDHASQGMLLGWGLRNQVGLVEHPYTGGIWGVENSVDQLTRDGEDIHTDNPGEELNFLGYLNGTETPGQGTNFGYPGCWATWGAAELPMNEDLAVGIQFADNSDDDDECRDNRTAPRLTWQAHTAPLDIKFNNSASEAWVSFHGSWNRDDPTGYNIARIAWSNATGEPEAPADSIDSAQFVIENTDTVGDCPDNCFRPVGLAFDSQGRLWFSSDSSGEIYVLRRVEGANGTGPPETNPGGGGDGEDAANGLRASVTGLLALALTWAAFTMV